MMGADQPGFDVTKQGVDDREEFARIGAGVLDHRCVLQMLCEIGAMGAIAGKPVGQQMRIGELAATLALRKAPNSAPVAAGSTAMRHRRRKTPEILRRAGVTTEGAVDPALFDGVHDFNLSIGKWRNKVLATLLPEALAQKPTVPRGWPPLDECRSEHDPQTRDKSERRSRRSAAA
jgi:hypothetical protein